MPRYSAGKCGSLGDLTRKAVLMFCTCSGKLAENKQTAPEQVIHTLMLDLDWDLLSSYAGLLSLASLSIYAGAFGSLPVRAIFRVCQKSYMRKQNPKRPQQGGDNGVEEEIEERLSSEDAWLFPVVSTPLGSFNGADLNLLFRLVR